MKRDILDKQLITLASNKEENSIAWTVRNAVEGVQIFGGIGSGKTTSSGRLLALKYLSAGFGGLVLTVKPDEKDLWVKYCDLTGRSSDLVIIEPGGDNFFDFLQYEVSQSADKNAVTENVVQVLKTVMQADKEKSQGASDDAFWEKALDMLLFNIIDLCLLAYGTISVKTMYDIAQSLPVKDVQHTTENTSTPYKTAYNKAVSNVNTKIEEWEARQGPERIKALGPQATLLMKLEVPEVRAMEFIRQFFKETYTNLAEKTRSIVDFSFTGFLFRLLREPVYSMFCGGKTTISPSDSLKGKIILLNLPVKLFHKVGRDVQILFKYVWQRAMEQRKIVDDSIPVFLWADEAQNFLHEHDAEYQATARSSMIATVYISQNLPNYYANMGGGKFEFRVKSFLGTLSTKIFHANADMETNNYASELIGNTYFRETSETATAAGQFSSSLTKNFKLNKTVRPEQFNSLKTGGLPNNNKAEAYVHIQGHESRSKPIIFDQDFIPNVKIPVS